MVELFRKYDFARDAHVIGFFFTGEEEERVERILKAAWLEIQDSVPFEDSIKEISA